MFARSLFAISLLTLFLCAPALAVKVEHEMTPANSEWQGFALATRLRDDGSILVSVTRDTAKAHWPKRDGALEIYGDAGRIVWCRLEPKRVTGKEKNLVRYEFIVSEKHLTNTVFTVAEVQTADGEEDGEQVLGGGDFFRFRMADFAQKPEKSQKTTRCGDESR
jgi:hypothetical protein